MDTVLDWNVPTCVFKRVWRLQWARNETSVTLIFEIGYENNNHERQTDRQAGRQIDRQTDRQKERNQEKERES